MDGHERLDLTKLDAFGRPGRVTVYHGFANGLLRDLRESGGFSIDEQVGFENYYQWILPGDQLDASGKVPAAGQVSSRGILEWCSPYGRLPFGAGRLFPGSLNMSRSDDAGVGAAESDLPADALSVTLHTRDIRSMTVVGDAVILNDGLIHRLTGDGVLHGGFHNMHVASDLVQPFGKLEGTETGIFVQILDDENGEDSGTVRFFPSLGTTEPLVLKLGQIKSLVWSRPFLYFLRRGGGGGESLSICSVEVNEHGPTSTEVVELYHLNSPGKSVTQMVTLGGSLFTLEDGVLHRTHFEAHDRLVGADRPPPRV